MGRTAAISWMLTAAVLLAAAPVYAQRTYSVRIESEPEGAKVFIDDPFDPMSGTDDFYIILFGFEYCSDEALVDDGSRATTLGDEDFHLEYD